MHVGSDRLADEVDHPSPRPRSGEIDLAATDRHDRRAERVAGGLDDEPFGDRHHVGDVGKRLVQLHHRELGVVTGGDALVAEDAAHLVHPLHATDDQALEVQFERDPQVQLHVERVVVGDERPGVGATGLDVQDRRLDLGEAFGGERPAEARHELVTDLERPPGFLVDDQVGVALAVADVDVGQTVPLVGQRAQGFGEQLQPVDLDRELALAGGHHLAVHTDPVAEVERLDVVEWCIADLGLRHEELDLTAAIAHRREHELARVAQQHQPAGGIDLVVRLGAGLERSPSIPDLTERVRAVEPVRVWLDTAITERSHPCVPAGPLGDETAARRRDCLHLRRPSC